MPVLSAAFGFHVRMAGSRPPCWGGKISASDLFSGEGEIPILTKVSKDPDERCERLFGKVTENPRGAGGGRGLRRFVCFGSVVHSFIHRADEICLHMNTYARAVKEGFGDLRCKKKWIPQWSEQVSPAVILGQRSKGGRGCVLKPGRHPKAVHTHHSKCKGPQVRDLME